MADKTIIEIKIGEKVYKFRSEFSAADYCEIGIPLVNYDRYKTTDPVTKEVKLTMDLSNPSTLDPEDLRAMNRWYLWIAQRMSADHTDWMHNKNNVKDFVRVIQDPQFMELTKDLMQMMNPSADPIPQIEGEKKKIP